MDDRCEKGQEAPRGSVVRVCGGSDYTVSDGYCPSSPVSSCPSQWATNAPSVHLDVEIGRLRMYVFAQSTLATLSRRAFTSRESSAPPRLEGRVEETGSGPGVLRPRFPRGDAAGPATGMRARSFGRGLRRTALGVSPPAIRRFPRAERWEMGPIR